jgi:hypothetical protein
MKNLIDSNHGIYRDAAVGCDLTHWARSTDQHALNDLIFQHDNAERAAVRPVWGCTPAVTVAPGKRHDECGRADR